MEKYLDQAPCFFFSTGDDGSISEVNQSLCLALDFSKEELIGKKVDLIFTIGTRIFHQTHFSPLLKLKGEVSEIYITLLSRNKVEIPVLINANGSMEQDGWLIRYVGITVHNRKKFEDELVAARRAAEAALNENTSLLEARKELQHHMEKLDQQLVLVYKQNEELKQFNRVISHDLQEPLRKLSVFSNMLLDKDDDTITQEKIVEKLLRVSQQMRSIISGLQEYVWLTETTNHVSNLNLNDLLPLAIKQLKDEFPLVELDLKFENLPYVWADRDQMYMLFYQLLSNVIRFRKNDNKAVAHLYGDKIQLNKFRKIKDQYDYTGFIKIELTDQGIGLNPDFIDQVFELFKRLHPVSGSGIGLSLCKKIVENHHGSISMDSQPDVGTTVTILLPGLDLPR